MLQIPELGIYFSIVTFFIGSLGLMLRKNILFMMLSLEVMLNAANLAFVSASILTGTIDGQVMMFFVIAVAACEAGIGLAFIVAMYRKNRTLDIDEFRMLRG